MMRIKILGVNDSKDKALTSNLLQAIDMLPFKATIQYVRDIEGMLSLGINRIPALVVNGSLISEGDIPSSGELRTILLNLITNTNYLAMKNIIVPTDFSNTSQNAYEYAVKLAEQAGGKIEVVHVFHGAFAPNESFVVAMPPMEGLNEAKQKMLREFVNSVDAAVPVGQSLEIGFTVETLVERSEGTNCDLLVMGATGEHDLFDKMFGSVSADVAQQAHCPVLLVPRRATFNGFKNILYATSDLATDRSLISAIGKTAVRFGADVHFVHVGERDTDTDENLISKMFEELFQGKEPSFSFQLSSISSESVVDALHEYAHKYAIDLIVVVTKHRSFIEKMLHKSMTKQLAMFPQLPTMVLHLNDRSLQD
jgi:nucleotide-binding universal stress UspA family protein